MIYCDNPDQIERVRLRCEIAMQQKIVAAQNPEQNSKAL
jgi:hypothetical protein